jgi:hypothetical protein
VGLAHVALVDDVVAPEDLGGAMARDLHGDVLVNTDPDQVAQRGPPEVVDDLVRDAGGDRALWNATANFRTGLPWRWKIQGER